MDEYWRLVKPRYLKECQLASCGNHKHMSERVNVLSKAVIEPFHGSPVDSNGEVVSNIVPMVSSLNISQDEVTRFLNCN